MTADNRSGIRKIAVAFDPGCAAPALLEAAMDLAISLGADLEALLVDDPDIARMSQLPFGRIFDLHTGKAAIFDKRAVQTRRAGPLALARATMRRTAERRRVFCSVRELPGIGLIDATLKSNAELFVIAGFHAKFGGARSVDRDAVQAAAGVRGSVLLVSQLPVETRHILVVADAGPLGERAAGIARRIARRGSPAGAAQVDRIEVGAGGHENFDAVLDRVLSATPTLVVTGLSDGAAVSTLHERLGLNSISVLTVR